MDKIEFSEPEMKLLRHYQAFSQSRVGRLNRLAVEIVPPIVLLAIGLVKDSHVYAIITILLLITFNVKRVLNQDKTIPLLKSISIKSIGSDESTTSPIANNENTQ